MRKNNVEYFTWNLTQRWSKKSLPFLMLVILQSGIFLTACNDEQPDTDSSCQDAIELTIKNFTGLDGCSWVLTSNAFDTSLEPLNLLDFIPEPEDGQVIKARYAEKPDFASICLVGTIVEIECIEE